MSDLIIGIDGVVTWVEDKVKKGFDGRPDQAFRVVTVSGGPADGKPMNYDIEVMNGTKFERGQKVKLAVRVQAGRNFGGQYVKVDPSLRLVE